MSDLNLYSVNWQDGMLVTQQNLKDQETYFEELAQWYARSVGDQYGLVRKSFGGKPALTMNVSASGNRLRVGIVRCHAMTPDGSVIEINESNQTGISAEAEAPGEIVPVFLGIDKGLRKQVGEPDPREDLPRVPYLAGNYLVSLGTPPPVAEGQFLQIAELVVRGSDVSHSEQYYPPCFNLYADERLTQKVHDFRNRLENLLSMSSRAYAAITAGGSLSGEKTELQQAFRNTIYQFAYHLSASLDDFVIGPNAPHPIRLVVFFKKLFRTFTTLLNLHPGLKDYLNEKFFVKQMNSEVGRFMSGVDAFLLAPYNHQDIGSHITGIEDTLTTVREIIGFLAQVRKDELGEQAVATDTLTYRGRTYRVLNYGSNRLERMGELNYLLIDVAEPCAVSDLVVLMGKDLFSAQQWSAMQVRLGINEARGLGETDPVDIDAVAFGNKVALKPQDMLKQPMVNQVTLIFRGAGGAESLDNMGKMDLIVYTI